MLVILTVWLYKVAIIHCKRTQIIVSPDEDMGFIVINFIVVCLKKNMIGVCILQGGLAGRIQQSAKQFHASGGDISGDVQYSEISPPPKWDSLKL